MASCNTILNYPDITSRGKRERDGEGVHTHEGIEGNGHMAERRRGRRRRRKVGAGMAEKKKKEQILW